MLISGCGWVDSGGRQGNDEPVVPDLPTLSYDEQETVTIDLTGVSDSDGNIELYRLELIGQGGTTVPECADDFDLSLAATVLDGRVLPSDVTDFDFSVFQTIEQDLVETPDVENPGVLTVTAPPMTQPIGLRYSVLVRDNDGGESTNTQFVCLNSINDAPVITTPSPYFAVEGATQVYDNEIVFDALPDLVSDDEDITNAESIDITISRQAVNGSVTVDSGGIITYTHDGSETTSDSFEFRAFDGVNASFGTITFAVDDVNDAPVGGADAYSVNEGNIGVSGSSISGNVLDNDTDAETPDTLGVALVPGTEPLYGTFSLNNDGTFTYDHNGSDELTDSFRYFLSDGFLDVEVAATINVTPINDAPVFSVSTPIASNEDTAGLQAGLVGVLTASDGDADGVDDTLAYQAIPDDAAQFSVQPSVNPVNGDLTYTPADNVFGSFGVTIRAIDEGASGAPGHVNFSDQAITLNITAVNDMPIANDDSGVGFTVVEDSAGNILDVLANDTDVDVGDTKEIIAVGATSNGGTATFIAGVNNTISYTPAADFAGTETFTYTMRDSAGATDTATVSVTVTAVNDPPVAVDDSGVGFAVAEDSTNNSLDVLANDTDVDAGDTKEITAVGATSNGGTATFVAGVNNTISYTPAADFVGTETFTYTMRDAAGLTDTATVSVTVTQVNDPPVAVNDSGVGFTVAEDSGTTALDALANDTDIDVGDTKEITAVGATNNGGTATFVAGVNNTISYTPAANFFGTETFTYTMRDAAGLTDTATVTVTVTSVNDQPVANNDSGAGFSVAEDSSNNSLNVLANDTDVDTGDTKEITAVGATNNGGTAVLSGSGVNNTITYTPAADFVGTETFSYTMQDSGGLTDTATVSVVVTDVNDSTPVVTPTTLGIAENSANSTSVGTVSATDADSGTTFSGWTITSGNTGGAFSISGNTGTNNATIRVNNSSQLDFEVTQTFNLQVTVSDGVNTSSAAAVTVNVSNVNDVAPVVTAATLDVDENAGNGTTVGTVAATDADSASFSDWTIESGNTGSAFQINASTGEITVQTSSALDFSSTPSYSLGVTVSDGVNTSAEETITVNINPIVSITSGSPPSVSENDGSDFYTITADGGTGSYTFSIAGIDAGDFSVNASTGALRFDPAPDFELPTDSNGDNIYQLTLRAEDSGTNVGESSVLITVIDVADSTSSRAFSAAVSDPPNMGCWATPQAEAISGTLAQVDETDPLQFFSIDSDPSNGVVAITDNQTGDFTYTPTAGASRGIDTFDFVYEDADGNASVRRATVIVHQAVMALGDSITEGVINGSASTPAIASRSGYRLSLAEQLSNDGYAVDWVGSQQVGASLGGFDADVEAHSDYSAEELAYGRSGGGIFEWLETNPADIILVHAGSYSLSASASGISALLDEVDRWENSANGNPVHVLVAGIVDQTDFQADVINFNSAVEAHIATRTSDFVSYVDMFNSLAYPDDLHDGFHPSESGYSKMADTWYSHLTVELLLDLCVEGAE